MVLVLVNLYLKDHDQCILHRQLPSVFVAGGQHLTHALASPLSAKTGGHRIVESWPAFDTAVVAVVVAAAAAASDIEQKVEVQAPKAAYVLPTAEEHTHFPCTVR